MTGHRIRVGLIGTGRIAGFVHLPSLRLLPELCEVTAVASRDAHKAKAFAEQWGVPRVHETWDEMNRMMGWGKAPTGDARARSQGDYAR